MLTLVPIHVILCIIYYSDVSCGWKIFQWKNNELFVRPIKVWKDLQSKIELLFTKQIYILNNTFRRL